MASVTFQTARVEIHRVVSAHMGKSEKVFGDDDENNVYTTSIIVTDTDGLENEIMMYHDGPDLGLQA